MKNSLFALLAVCLILAGCGGGGSTSPGSEETIANYGGFQTRASGPTPQVQVTNSTNGPVVTAVAGSTFTSIAYIQPHDLNSTSIAFGMQGSVYSLSKNDGSVNLLSQTLSNVNSTPTQSWSRDGKIVYSLQPIGSTNFQLYVANADGSSAYKLFPGTTTNDIGPAWSPVNNYIVFSRFSGTYNLWRVNSDGTGLLRLTNDAGADNTDAAWSADGTKIYYARSVVGTSQSQIYTVPATGGATTLASSALSSMTVYSPAPSPDGTRVLVTVNNPNATLYLMTPAGDAADAVISNTANNSSSAGCWAPDSSRFAFVQSDGTHYSILTANRDGGDVQNLYGGYSTLLQAPAWSRFNLPKSFVGTSGSFGTQAAGFIFAQDYSAPTGVAVFNATTPSSATIASDNTGNGAHNLVYVLHADSITYLKYLNGVYGNPIAVIGPNGGVATAVGALVTFNSVSGQVSGVAPFTAKRSMSRVRTSKQGETVYQGDFLGVWNDKGLNVAPGGASAVRVSKMGLNLRL